MSAVIPRSCRAQLNLLQVLRTSALVRASLVVTRACQNVLAARVLFIRSRTVVRGSSARKLSTAEDKAVREVEIVKTSSFDVFGLFARKKLLPRLCITRASWRALQVCRANMTLWQLRVMRFGAFACSVPFDLLARSSQSQG